MNYRAITQDGQFLTPGGRLTHIPEKGWQTPDFGMLQRAATRHVRSEGTGLIIVQDYGTDVEQPIGVVAWEMAVYGGIQ